MLIFGSLLKCECHSVSAMNPMSMQNLVTLAAMTGGNGANLQVSPTGKFIIVVCNWAGNMHTLVTNPKCLQEASTVILVYKESIIVTLFACMHDYHCPF